MRRPVLFRVGQLLLGIVQLYLGVIQLGLGVSQLCFRVQKLVECGFQLLYTVAVFAVAVLIGCPTGIQFLPSLGQRGLCVVQIVLRKRRADLGFRGIPTTQEFVETAALCLQCLIYRCIQLR